MMKLGDIRETRYKEFPKVMLVKNMDVMEYQVLVLHLGHGWSVGHSGTLGDCRKYAKIWM